MLVPSIETNRAPAAKLGVEAERISPPGAATSGFRLWPKAVGPAAEKLVITALRPVTTSVTPGPIRIDARPPRAARYARRFAPSRFVIIPAGNGNWSGMGLGSPSRLS